MKANSDNLAQRVALFTEGLRNAGVKVTHQRLEIFRELALSTAHPDAETIYRHVRKRMPTVSLDTVYRTLWLLLDLGLVRSIGGRDRVRFDGNAKDHHHFICQRCGETQDFYHEVFDHLELPGDIGELGRVECLQVELRGLCVKCVKNSGKVPRSAGAVAAKSGR
jgi:Fur family peroxide stress response transcriptional regulator